MVNKVVFLGEGRVGKTSLILRYCRNSFNPDQPETIGMHNLDQTIKLESGPVHIDIWVSLHRSFCYFYFFFCLTLDRILLVKNSLFFCLLITYSYLHLPSYNSLGPIYYQGAKGAILVYDITDVDSFVKVKRWVKELHSMVGTNIKIVICANKIDREKEKVVDTSQAEQYASSVGAQHFYTSAKTGKGVKEVFQTIAQGLHSSLFSIHFFLYSF